MKCHLNQKWENIASSLCTNVLIYFPRSNIFRQANLFYSFFSINFFVIFPIYSALKRFYKNRKIIFGDYLNVSFWSIVSAVAMAISIGSCELCVCAIATCDTRFLIAFFPLRISCACVCWGNKIFGNEKRNADVTFDALTLVEMYTFGFVNNEAKQKLVQ